MMAKQIGIVGGNGWIGGALARSLVETGLLAAEDLTLSCRSAPPDWLPGAVWTHDNRWLAERADTVILSVRPQDWPGIEIAAPGKLVISVMAGITLADISARTGSNRVVRALPNAAADVGKSYTPWVASEAATAADRETVRDVFAACGTEDEVPSESHIDYLTGHSGTGPAYPALLALAMMQDAIRRGVPPDVARRAVTALLIGTGRLFEKTGEHPADTVETFTAYGGVTAAGLQTMLDRGFQDVVSAGLDAALSRAIELGRPRG